MNTNSDAVVAGSNTSNHGLNQHGRQALERGKDKLVLDLKAVADDAQALLKEIVDTSTESIAGVPAYLEERVGKIKGDLSRARDAIQSKARHATRSADNYVRENPWKTMGCIAAASVMLTVTLMSACAHTAGAARGDGK